MAEAKVARVNSNFYPTTNAKQKLELKSELDMNAGANIKCQQSAEQSVENKVWLALA